MIWKKDNEIQLTKNKMDLNNLEIKKSSTLSRLYRLKNHYSVSKNKYIYKTRPMTIMKLTALWGPSRPLLTHPRRCHCPTSQNSCMRQQLLFKHHRTATDEHSINQTFKNK